MVAQLNKGMTFFSSMWGSMISLVGAENVAPAEIGKWGTLAAEKVLAAKPDAIIITGRETELKKNQDGMVMGFGIEKAEAERRLNAFKHRAGWAELPAVKTTVFMQPIMRTLVLYQTVLLFSLWLKPLILICLKI